MAASGTAITGVTSCGAAAAAVYPDYLATGTPLSSSTGGRAFGTNAGGAIYTKNSTTALTSADLVAANRLKEIHTGKTREGCSRSAGIPLCVYTDRYSESCGSRLSSELREWNSRVLL